MTPKAQATEQKHKEVDYIKLQTCTAKEVLTRVKRQPTEWKIIFENQISDKGLISKIHKELIQLYSK